VLFQPPGCDLLSASQGKAGKLVIYDTNSISAGPLAQYQFSQSNTSATYVGNPAYSPITNLLYATVASSMGATLPAGIAAISTTGCTPQIAWSTAFGPDSLAYGYGIARSPPVASAGGVVLMGTPCTPNAQMTNCVTPTAAQAQGAVWALDATTGAVLNGGAPIVITAYPVRMPPVVDGQWIFIQDVNGGLYGLEINSSQTMARKTGQVHLHSTLKIEPMRKPIPFR
jgi:hypothetical protein